jgi:hypothetical protein
MVTWLRSYFFVRVVLFRNFTILECNKVDSFIQKKNLTIQILFVFFIIARKLIVYGYGNIRMETKESIKWKQQLQCNIRGRATKMK